MERSGFFVSPKLCFLGCSPDRKVVDIACPEEQFGLAEVKCRSSKFSVSPVEACSDPNIYLEIKDGIPRQKRTIFIMIKSRVKWHSLVQNGATLFCTQAGDSALRGSILTRSTGIKIFL